MSSNDFASITRLAPEYVTERVGEIVSTMLILALSSYFVLSFAALSVAVNEMLPLNCSASVPVNVNVAVAVFLSAE